MEQGFAPNSKLEITPSFLRELITLVRSRGFETLSLGTMVERLKQGRGTGKPMAVFTFSPAPGSGMIVLYRNIAGFLGAGAGVNTTINVDGKVLGDLAQDHYAVIEVAPGEHTVKMEGASGVSNVLATLAAGEVRYYQVVTNPTLSNTQRQQPDAMKDLDNEGEALVESFKYSFTSAPGAAPAGNTTRL